MVSSQLLQRLRCGNNCVVILVIDSFKFGVITMVALLHIISLITDLPKTIDWFSSQETFAKSAREPC